MVVGRGSIKRGERLRDLMRRYNGVFVVRQHQEVNMRQCRRILMQKTRVQRSDGASGRLNQSGHLRLLEIRISTYIYVISIELQNLLQHLQTYSRRYMDKGQEATLELKDMQRRHHSCKQPSSSHFMSMARSEPHPYQLKGLCWCHPYPAPAIYRLLNSA